MVAEVGFELMPPYGSNTFKFTLFKFHGEVS